MRLLDTSTIELKDFFGDDVPEYAILSHRWGYEEVSFQELGTPKSHKKAGYSKILNACALAKSYGFKYIWIDTCCIDKSSSAELSEAINCMYQWYSKAYVCYAYLADILLPVEGIPASRKFVDSEWFKRGWTLQELLAPEEVIFFDKEWREIGTKRNLESIISTATRIHHKYLQGYSPGFNRTASIAEKMSWASSRTTSRPEDIAYCLMGIMNVNMPLLYGEGEKAFLRLQEELIKVESDESIYAWNIQGLSEGSATGILAPSPRHFAGCGNLVTINLPGLLHEPWSITNYGLAMTVACLEREVDHLVMEGVSCYEVPIACAEDRNLAEPIRLCLCKDGNGIAWRIQGTDLPSPTKLETGDFKFEKFYVRLDQAYRGAQGRAITALDMIGERSTI